jgi:type IV pilus biogenesis protein CpaD/CtpE
MKNSTLKLIRMAVLTLATAGVTACASQPPLSPDAVAADQARQSRVDKIVNHFEDRPLSNQ